MLNRDKLQQKINEVTVRLSPDQRRDVSKLCFELFHERQRAQDDLKLVADAKQILEAKIDRNERLLAEHLVKQESITARVHGVVRQAKEVDKELEREKSVVYKVNGDKAAYLLKRGRMLPQELSRRAEHIRDTMLKLTSQMSYTDDRMKKLIQLLNSGGLMELILRGFSAKMFLRWLCDDRAGIESFVLLGGDKVKGCPLCEKNLEHYHKVGEDGQPRAGVETFKEMNHELESSGLGDSGGDGHPDREPGPVDGGDGICGEGVGEAASPCGDGI